MRPDLFQDKKCVHVKLDKLTHASLRAALFQRGLSMQEIFDDYARLITQEDFRATRMLDNLAMRKLQDKIDGVSRRGLRPVSELDTDALYHLIEGDNNTDKEREAT